MLVPLSATQTHDRARRLMQAGRGAALPELLRIIETLSRNACEVTISELCEIIEKDAIILGKILTVANTLYYNPGVARLESLSQAIHHLGFNRIRTLAVSLMLIQTASGEHSAPEQREAATRALCSGLVAQGAAEWLGTSDPEFAFACATLRDFGRIMFASISPPLCRAAALRAPIVGDAEAHREHFGLTPLAFSHGLLAAAGLPATVLASLRACEPESLKSAASTFDNRLLGLADFGNRVAHLALDSSQPSEAFVSGITQLCTRFEFLVPGATDLVRPSLQRADDRIRAFAGGLKGTLPSALKIDRIGWRLRQLTAVTAPVVDPAAVASNLPSEEFLSAAPQPIIDALPPPTTSAEPPSADADWDLLMAHSTKFEVPAAEPDPQEPIDDALAEVAAAVGAEDCWWFEHQPGLPGAALVQRHSLDRARPPSAARAEVSERSVFGVCLTRREVVLIHDTAEANLRPYLPGWFRSAERPPAAFALIPVLNSESISGLLLVGWTRARRITLSVAEITVARQRLTASLKREHPVAA